MMNHWLIVMVTKAGSAMSTPEVPKGQNFHLSTIPLRQRFKKYLFLRLHE